MNNESGIKIVTNPANSTTLYYVGNVKFYKYGHAHAHIMKKRESLKTLNRLEITL